MLVALPLTSKPEAGLSEFQIMPVVMVVANQLLPVVAG